MKSTDGGRQRRGQGKEDSISAANLRRGVKEGENYVRVQFCDAGVDLTADEPAKRVPNVGGDVSGAAALQGARGRECHGTPECFVLAEARKDEGRTLTTHPAAPARRGSTSAPSAIATARVCSASLSTEAQTREMSEAGQT
jgi:hypothetical protein